MVLLKENNAAGTLPAVLRAWQSFQSRFCARTKQDTTEQHEIEKK